MDTIMSAKRGEAPEPGSPQALEAEAAREKEAERKARHERSKRIAAQRKATEEPVVVPERSDVAADVEVPSPPFWGSRIVKGLALADYTGLLDERALFLGQWGLRGVRGGDGTVLRGARRDRGPAAAAVLAGPACPPTACWRTRPWCTAISRWSPRATTSFCSPSPGPMPSSDSGSPSRVSNVTGSCASPTSSGHGSWPPSGDRLTCCRSSW